MKTSCLIYLKGIITVLLVCGITLGEEIIPAPSVPSPATPPTSSGLTPRQKSKTNNPVVLAQQLSRTESSFSQPLPAAPSLNNNSPILVADAKTSTASSVSADPFVYSELDRLAAEVANLKKETKKLDTKKAWSSPKLNGRLFLDSYSIDQSTKDRTINDLNNKSGIREMQFSITGNGFDSFDYKFELSLAPDAGRVQLVDNWVGIKNVPLFGYVRAGHFKPETGLAYPTSALHTALTEFVGPSGTFGFGRRYGVSSEHMFAKDRIRLFYGVFQGDTTNLNRYIEDDNTGEVVNVRLSAAPIFENEGRQVLHLGGHWSYVNSRNDHTSLSIQPGAISWLSSSLGTGTFDNNNHHRFGFELALQNGAFSASSEIYVAKYNSYGTAPDRTANGAYVLLGYFLTGENRTYNLHSAVFGAAKVNHPFHPFKAGECNLVDGLGAWQLIAQWNYLDLTDWRNVGGGFQHDLTLGLNWFWNPNIRWIFEYVHSQRNKTAAFLHLDEDIFGTSLRLHF